MTYLIIISYILIVFLVYTILRIKENREDSGFHAMSAIFWPIMGIVIIVAAPFYIIDKIVKKYI